MDFFESGGERMERDSSSQNLEGVEVTDEVDYSAIVQGLVEYYSLEDVQESAAVDSDSSADFLGYSLDSLALTNVLLFCIFFLLVVFGFYHLLIQVLEAVKKEW